MFWTFFVILLIMWLFGLLSGVGGFIHLLLIAAGAILVFNLVRNRRQAF